jgi:ABC-type glutathione transport system ATPase component
MSEGQIVEVGPTERVMDAPEAEYTRRLLADSPSLRSELPSPAPPGR